MDREADRMAGAVQTGRRARSLPRRSGAARDRPPERALRAAQPRPPRVGRRARPPRRASPNRMQDQRWRNRDQFTPVPVEAGRQVGAHDVALFEALGVRDRRADWRRSRRGTESRDGHRSRPAPGASPRPGRSSACSTTPGRQPLKRPSKSLLHELARGWDPLDLGRDPSRCAGPSRPTRQAARSKPRSPSVRARA